jgi:hypothetical protein
MLNTNYNFFALTNLCFLLFLGCPAVTFEYLDLSCSIGSDQDYFFEDYIQIKFSQTPDKNEAENKIQLYEGTGIVLAEFIWQSNVLLIQPKSSWQKGQFYSLNLEGSLRMENGSHYTVYLFRSFIYGQRGNDFELISSGFERDILTFVFSKPVLITSFMENFTLTPFTEYITTFSDDGAAVTIAPKNNWSENNVYAWTIKNMLSNDRYLMKKEYSGKFYGLADAILPQFEQAYPVSYSEAGSSWQWHHDMNIRTQLLEWHAIGFTFSKPMNEASIKAGITFYPNINGYFIKETDKNFIFVPEEAYQIKKEYRITIADTIKDTSNLELYEQKLLFFTTANEFITVLSITFDNDTVPMPTDGTIADHYMSSSIPAKLVTVINFSTAIPQRNHSASVDAVSLSALFPPSAESPDLISAVWSLANTCLTLTWETFTITSMPIENYYILEIGGGANGVKNIAGEYLEEDVCVIFKAL